MAKIKSDISLEELKKLLGKEMVVKQYAHGKVITKFPDMSNIVPSKQQKQERSKFKEAVAYAQVILQDPEKKAAYQKKIAPGQTVYHFALKEYLQSC